MNIDDYGTFQSKKEQPFDLDRLRREMELYHSVGFCEGVAVSD